MRPLHHRLLVVAIVAVPLVVVASLRAAPATPCTAFEIEYALSANLRLTETPMGKGDGMYLVGPGSVVLRFENHDGVPGGAVSLLSYQMHEHFVIHATALFWQSNFASNTDTAVAPNACGVAAQGALTGDIMKWSTPLLGYRTDGEASCRGSLCGKGGAPPPGTTELHIGPRSVWFSPFHFAPDFRTFTMQSTQVTKSESPKLTASIALAGREVRRSCVQAEACP